MTESTPAARFFAAYERNIAKGDLPAMIAQFAETYLYGGPGGHQFLRSADLAAGLPRRRQLLNSLGCGPSRMVSLNEIPLNERFVLAQPRWQFSISGDQSPVTIDSTFLLNIAEPVRILAYISHQDLVAELKARQREEGPLQVS